jgi:hypothetical protein
MNPHFEAQSILESLTWLSHDGLAGMTAETAELILVAETPWSIVLDAAKAKLLVPQPSRQSLNPANVGSTTYGSTTYGYTPAPAPTLTATVADPAKMGEVLAAHAPAGAPAPAPVANLRPAISTAPVPAPPRKMAGM